MRSIFSLVVVVVALSGCGKQSPVAVVDGYNKQRTVYNNTAPVNAADRAFNMQSEAIVGFQQEDTYYVHGGDKLEQIAKHFGVREEAILARNNLISEADVTVGEYLTIPSPNWQASNMPSDMGASYRLTDKYNTAVAPQEDAVVQNNVTSQRQINLMRQHTLSEGENIYRVALRYNVSQFDILAANNIRNPSDLKPGMVLNIPQAGDVVTGRDEYRYLAQEESQAAVQSNNVIKSKVQNVPVQKMQVNRDVQVIKADTSSVQLDAEKSYYDALAQKYRHLSVSGKGMVWPANGQVIKTFGDKGQGVNHAGINIALAKDAPIHAAESGTVIYADNGLELYGNLVLIQHSKGYVTAYAHNNKNIVKRHDKVTKGQLIGFAGNTGNVSKTQLHFEVRKNAQAINPMKVLPRK
ncbi:MAG: murein DD-endopeptidase MepM/ murein hydrolase activator NlpD [bacterium]|jgi:murein DD-endopeptidase MepM/ murein hydrolase activator NlpD